MTNYISNLRNIATFSVIILHVSAIYVVNYNTISLADWKIANFIDSFVRFCVPIFLMISGALLLNKEENIKLFIDKRLKRVVIPFLFWNVIYFVYNNYNLNFSNIDFIKRFIFSFITGASFHFWYIYLIIGIYLFIPIIRKWTNIASKKEILYFLLIWSFTLFINDYTIKYFPKVELMYFSKYIGFLILGHYLNKYVPLKKYVFLSYIFFIIGFFLTYFSTYILSVKKDTFYSFFYEYLSPNVVIASIGMFIIIKNLNIKVNRFFIQCDSLSYGIYLVHIIVLNILIGIIDRYELNVFTSIVVLSFLTYIISFLVIYILSRFKYLRKIVT